MLTLPPLVKVQVQTDLHRPFQKLFGLNFEEEMQIVILNSEPFFPP